MGFTSERNGRVLPGLVSNLTSTTLGRGGRQQNGLTEPPRYSERQAQNGFASLEMSEDILKCFKRLDVEAEN